MTAPSVVGTPYPGRDSGQTTTHTIAELAPAGRYAVGDRLLVVYACDSNSNLVSIKPEDSTADWVLTGPEAHTGSFHGAVVSKIAASLSETLALSTSVIETGSYVLYVIRGSGVAPVSYGVKTPFKLGASASTFVQDDYTPPGGLQDYLSVQAVLTDSTLVYSGASGDFAGTFGAQNAVSTSGASISYAHAAVNSVATIPGATFSAGGNRVGLGITIALWEDTGGGVDESPPTMVGQIQVTAYTEGGGDYTTEVQEAVDNVGIDHYETSVNGGADWINKGLTRSHSVTGATPGTTASIRWRAWDAAGNVSTPLALELPVGGRYLNGLSFPSNDTAGSDVKIQWRASDSAMPPRKTTTTLFWVKPRSQAGFFAWLWWLSRITGIMPANLYFVGFHPYPCDGTVNPDGGAAVATGDAGTDHYAEIAGLPNKDYIRKEGGGSFQIVTGAWYAVAAETRIVGSDVRHTLWPDVFGNPSVSLVVDVPAADIDAVTLESAAQQFGAPHWKTSGDSNDETVSGEVIGLRSFDNSISALSFADVEAELEALWEQNNTPATSAGAAAVWYINDEWQVADIADKSGEGHNPVWGSSERPTAYSEIVASSGGTSQALAADAAAQSAGSAALNLAKTLLANAAAQASGAADLAKGAPLAANAAAQSEATASLLHGVLLAAAGIASASSGATMAHEVPLTASAAAVALAGAQLVLAVTLGADALAQAAASASLSTNAANALAADARSQAVASALLSLTVGLDAQAVAQAAASAALAMGKALSATAAAQANATAALTVNAGNELSANAAAQATAGASLALDVPISAAAVAQALAGGSLTVVLVLRADAVAQASGVAVLDQQILLRADGQAIATASGALTVVGEFARAPLGRGYPVAARYSTRPPRAQAGGRPTTSNTRRP